MKSKIAIVLLIVFCFTELRPALPFLDYFVNYEYISEVLCINKSKPMSACNGKCYLRQQLNESQDTEKQNKNIATVAFERIPMIIHSAASSFLFVPILESQRPIKFYNFPVKNLFISPPTPPPKC